MKPTPSTLRRADTRIVLSLAIAAVSCCSTGVASADCSPVIAAYAKAESAGRYAIYGVSSLTAAPKQPAFAIVIGRDLFMSPMEDGKYTRSSGGVAASEGSSLKEREKAGKARCDVMPARPVGTEPATGYEISDTAKPKDPYAIDFYVSKATGLPVWHGMGSDGGGFLWKFGDSIAAPAAARIAP
jgi:hypothetical protein